MKKFSFRFQSYLQKIIKEEEAIQKEMAPIVQKYNSVQESISKSEGNLKMTRFEKNRFLEIENQRMLHMSLINSLKKNINKLSIHLKKIDGELDSFRKRLKEKYIKRRSLEILKEKDHKEYLKKVKKENQILLEESFLSQKRLKKEVKSY